MFRKIYDIYHEMNILDKLGITKKPTSNQTQRAPATKYPLGDLTTASSGLHYIQL